LRQVLAHGGHANAGLVALAAVPSYVRRYSIDQQIAGCCFLKVSCGLRARSRITPAESMPKTGVV
jgi:hypothetical protein